MEVSLPGKIQFKIGNINLTETSAPLIVPEIGINHNGKLETAIKMVDAAVKNGARIIKHQTHIPDDEMSVEAKKIKPGNSKKNIFSIIKKCSLNEEDEFKLMRYVRSKKVIFLSTPFSRKAVDRLIKFKVDAFKIGSGEFNNLPLINYITKFNRPMILSTGMNSLKDIKKIGNFLINKKIKFALLHTTSLYPVPDNLVRMSTLNDLKKTFPNNMIGYSDHTIGNTACYLATSLGAKIIEKHFVDKKSRKGPDVICSMDSKDLNEIIINTKRINAQLQGGKKFLKEEQITRNFAFCSVISVKKIEINEKLTEENIWVKRPGTGNIDGFGYFKILGKKAKKTIPAGQQIKWRDIR